MALRTRTFTVHEATIIVREPAGVDRIDARVIYGKLDYDRTSSRDRNRVQNFAEFVMQTVSLEGDMGYPWASLDSNDDDTQKAFDAWVEWPESLMTEWIGNLTLTTAPLSEPGTQPNENPKNEPPPQSTTESE
jgi:hypothetical protein